jgi:hypothetical protein
MKQRNLYLIINKVCLLLLLGLILIFGMLPATAQQNIGDPDPNVPNEWEWLRKPGGVDVILGTSATVQGDGYMVAGQLWQSIKPANSLNAGPGELADFRRYFLNLGGSHINNWTEPVRMWPGGWTHTIFWRSSGRAIATVYSSDPNFNPATVGGEANRAHNAESGGNYSYLYFSPNLPGANDPNRNYRRAPEWEDPVRRDKMVYEAGFPTTVGVDVRVKAIQYTRNFAGLNDFIVYEITFENTGVVDINGDGTAERTGNVIEAMGITMNDLPGISVQIAPSGGRLANRFGASRMMGYVADNDPTGAPWDMHVAYAGPREALLGQWDVTNPADRDFGVIDHANRGYSDIWGGWNFMGVKQGPSGDYNAPDKETIFGSHPVGEGPERGWYGSATDGNDFNSGTIPWKTFAAATATWYANYGRNKNYDVRDLSPNPNFFDSGTAGDVLSFVPKANPTRPNGDLKYASVDETPQVAFQQKPFEPGWTTGFNHIEPFSGRMVSGIGPFSLDVGESMTVVFVEYAGFRLTGVQRALTAARWSWERNWNIQNELPVPPTPHIKIEGTANQSALIRWTNEADADADGYKIWRAPQFKQIKYIDKGMRALANYWKQHSLTADPDQFLDPINPNFGGFDFAQPEDRGIYQPGPWGTFDLVKIIPKSELSQYASSSGEFAYAWEDDESLVGFTYWYYVSAYKEGTYTGPAGQTTTHLETSNFNRNGAVGIWQGTYPFSNTSPDFPGTPEGRARIGAGFLVAPPVANPADLSSGQTMITVSPNPYKIASLTDVRDDPVSHNIDFLNLPASCTITILDVSGQMILQEQIEGGTEGRWSWNMFSKDGVEVASGLYIYHVKYDGGEHLGHFAILR